MLSYTLKCWRRRNKKNSKDYNTLVTVDTLVTLDYLFLKFCVALPETMIQAYLSCQLFTVLTNIEVEVLIGAIKKIECRYS